LIPSRLRLVLRALLFAALCGMPLLAQEGQAQEAGGENLGIWKLINTAIFAVLLGWFLAKYAPRFFNARSADIQKAIKDATGLKIEADFRYSEIDKKMATLAEEVKRIREQSTVEMTREHERIRRQTEAEIDRIRQNAANEIEALRQEAANRVQLHTAQSALALAEKRLQDRFAQGEPGDLIDNFIRLVERGKN
jgi:F-type H+-transporting ATPase subunit b